MAVTKATLLLILSSIFCGIIGQFSLKLGAAKLALPAMAGPAWVPQFVLNVLLNPMIFLGLFMYTVGAFLWILVLRRTDLSLAYQFLSLKFVIILVGSALFLRESISAARMGGGALIVLGMLLISRG